MDGAVLVIVNTDAPTQIPFPQIMFHTKLNCAIPLALRAFHDEGPMKPTCKVNPRPEA